MGLDIRWPIGLMFSLIGLLLAGYGLMTASDAEMYKRSMEINVNLRWGIALLIFGGAMLFLAMRGSKAQAADSATDANKKN